MDFHVSMTQTEIGRRLGISQMHVPGCAPARSATSARACSTWRKRIPTLAQPRKDPRTPHLMLITYALVAGGSADVVPFGRQGRARQLAAGPLNGRCPGGEPCRTWRRYAGRAVPH